MTASASAAPAGANRLPGVHNRIDTVFERCRAENRAALILYLTAGFPDAQTTRRLLPVIAEAGCDLVELGIPFSDPIADGPVIQKASTVALEAGMTFPIALDILKEFRRGHDTPVVLFGALNPFLVRGLERAADLALDAGAEGVLAADLPIDEAADFRAILAGRNLHLITLAAPTTPDRRLAEFAPNCAGFLYCISYKGTTGTKSVAQDDLRSYLGRVKKYVPIPVAAGFGIRTAQDVRTAVAAGADAVVVGTSLISLIEEAGASGNVEQRVREYVTSLASQLKRS